MKLSVIIPVYNIRDHIAQAIASFCDQRRMDFELVVVDDGSTDDSLAVATKALEREGAPPHKIISRSNSGVSSARNAGIRAAEGDYVCFIDGDDYVAPDFAEKILDTIDATEAFEVPGADIVCWQYDIVAEDRTVITAYSSKYGTSPGRMSGREALSRMVVDKSLMVWTGSAAYRKDFLREAALWFTKGCISGEDQEFIFKALARAGRVFSIDSTLSFYVRRRGSISNRYDIGRFDSMAALRRTLEYFLVVDGAGMAEVAKCFEANNIIDNYLYNIRSCLRNSDHHDIRRLLAEIEAAYPGLNAAMRSAMKRAIRAYRYNPLKIGAFLLSPRLYQLMMAMKAKRLKKTESSENGGLL